MARSVSPSPQNFVVSQGVQLRLSKLSQDQSLTSVVESEIDRFGALAANILKTMGLELLGVIEPDLNWKTATKGRRSAVRRARTSFIGGCTVKTSISSKDIPTKDNMEDVSISDSEKVGVSILGQRFSESFRSVPIKKRRFLLACSPSPPPPSCQLDCSEDFLTSQMISSLGISTYEKHRKKRLISRKKYSFKNTNVKTCDTADFSGISILAAAACNSDIVGDILNAGGFNSKDISSMGNVLSNAKISEPVSSCEEKVQHMLIAENLERECNLPVEIGSSTLSVKVIDVERLPSNKHSVGPSQDISDRAKSSSCNPRLHWDLNTVMDAWEESCDEIVNCQPLTTDQKVEGSQDERNSVIDTCNSKVQTSCISELEDHSVDTLGSQMDEYVSLKAEFEKEHDMSNNKSADSGKAKQSSVFCVCGNDEMEQHLGVDSVSFVGPNEKTTPVNSQRIHICSAENISSADDRCSCLIKTTEKLKSDAVGKSVETEPASIVVYGENSASHSTTHKRHHNFPESSTDQNYDENVVDNESTGKSIVESNPDDHCLIDSQMQHFNLNLHIERSLDMHNSDNFNACPSTNHLDDKASMKLVDGNICAIKKATYDVSDEVVLSDGLVIAREHHTDESIREASREPCLPSTHCCGAIESSDNEILGSNTTHGDKHEMSTVGRKAVDSRRSMFSDVNLVCAKGDYNSLKASIPMSSSTTPIKVDADMVDGIKVESKCYLTSCEYGGLNDNLGCTSQKNSPRNNADQASAMENIHFLEDDDSQYEDGEFRGSILHGWGDAAEEKENEHLDCVSDNKEFDLEPPSVHPVLLPVDGMSCNNMQLVACDGARSAKDMELTIFQPLVKCSSISDPSDVEKGKSTAGTTHMDYSRYNGGRKPQKFVDDASVSTDNVAGYISYDCNKEASAIRRMKMSGWDQIHASRRHNMVSDNETASTECHLEGSFDPVAVVGSSRSGSTLRRDLSSRIKRLSTSDKSRGSYFREVRSDDRNDLNLKAEVDVGSLNLSGKYGPSCHAQGRDDGDLWFEPSSHCVRGNHDPSPYYDTSGFAESGSRNAAAAAVAKVQSNGFVVAPDGTIVKASDVGPGGRLHRRSTNNSLHASHNSISGGGSPCKRRLPCSREMSPVRHFTGERDRIGRSNHEMDRKYHRPVPDNDIQLDLLHLPRRDQSFSSLRANARLSSSHSRSPSRRRTRSPCNWTSPKARSRLRMDGDVVLRRRSRSPLISNSDARRKTTRSPYRQPNYGDRTVAYDPRIHASLPHAPWDSRKGSPSPDHFRELNYRQNSGSTVTMRMLRNQRFNSMDSQGRLGPDDSCSPLPLRRVPNLAGFGRGSRQDGIRDTRVDGYELPHLSRKHDLNAKHAHYDVKESFKNNSRGCQRHLTSKDDLNAKHAR